MSLLLLDDENKIKGAEAVLQMITNIINISTRTVRESPTYDSTFKKIKITDVIVTKEGMERGDPTVDFQCEDASGNKYLIVATGLIVHSIGLINKREMDRAQIMRDRKESMN